MAQKKEAILNLGKATAQISFTTLAAIGGATGNPVVAGLLALPTATLAALDTLWPQLQTRIASSEGQLRLPVPDWWNSDPSSWEDVCAEIEQALPTLAQDMEQRLNSFQGVITKEVVRDVFCDALIAHHLTWASRQEERKRIAEEVAIPILAKLAQVLQPLIEQLQKETLLIETHAIAQNISTIVALLSQLPDIFKDLLQNSARIKVEQDLQALKTKYFASIRQKYEYMDLGGISPKVTSRAEAHVVKIKMEDVFIQLKAREDLRVWKIQNLIAINSYVTVVIGRAEDDQVHLDVAASAASEIKDGEELGVSDRELSLKLEEPPIQPHLIHAAVHGFNSNIPIEIPHILQHHKVVILGHPGTGKSTLTKHVAYTIAQGKEDTLDDHLRGIIPVVIKAAEYGRCLKKDEDLSFYNYITGTRYGDEFGPLFRGALQHDKCLVIIDGLDEVPDSILRVRVGKKVQEFTSIYHQNRFLITSRIVGYRGNELVGDYTHFELEEWQPDQILSYLEKWYFALEESKSPSVEAACKTKAQTLWGAIKAREGIRKLAGTPLLLTIIALIHQYGRTLPERRVEFYELATETLLSNWPLKEREQQLNFRELLAILEPIAHRIFTSSPDRLITEYEFRPLFEEKVREVQGISAKQLKRASNRLLDQIEHHTGFFLSRGTNEQGQQVYGFLHPTFAEYLTARYLAQQWVKSPHQFEILPVLHEATWHEIILLLAGHLGGMMTVLVTRFVGYLEQVDTPYEVVLHRNLLLIADILADKVSLSRETFANFLARIISVALETPFFPLFESICQKLRRIVAVSPVASLPQIIRFQGRDSFPLQVRKVVLARSLKFQNQQDLGILVQGVLLDEETGKIAELGFGDFVNTALPLTHVLVIRENDFPTMGNSARLSALSKQAAAKIQSLPLPILNIEQLVGQLTIPFAGSRQVWVLDLEKYPLLAADLIAQITVGQWSFVEFLLRSTLTANKTIFHQVLIKWIKHISGGATAKEYQTALNALSILPGVAESTSVTKASVRSSVEAALETIFTTSDSPDDRAKALKGILWLSEASSKKWQTWIRRGFADPAKEVLIALMQVLDENRSRIKMPEFVAEQLNALLQHADADIHWIATKTLILSDHIEVRSVLLVIERIQERLRAITTSEELCTLIGYLIRMANQVRNKRTWNALSRALTQALEKKLAQEEVLAFSRLSFVLAHSLAEPLAKEIQSLLNHQEITVCRRAAIIGAAIRPEPPFLSYLFNLLSEKESEIRLVVLRTLISADLEEETTIERLLEAIRNNADQVRLAAMNLFAKRPLKSMEEVEVFLEVLQLGDQSAAYTAASTLSRVQEPILRKHVIEQAGKLMAADPANIPAYTLLWNLSFAKVPVGI